MTVSERTVCVVDTSTTAVHSTLYGIHDCFSPIASGQYCTVGYGRVTVGAHLQRLGVVVVRGRQEALLVGGVEHDDGGDALLHDHVPEVVDGRAVRPLARHVATARVPTVTLP